MCGYVEQRELMQNVGHMQEKGQCGNVGEVAWGTIVTYRPYKIHTLHACMLYLHIEHTYDMDTLYI